MSSEGDKAEAGVQEEPTVVKTENPEPQAPNPDIQAPVDEEEVKEHPRPAGPVCQIEECSRALVNSYDKKCRTCHIHRNSLEVIFRGVLQRFCQKCCRFHELDQFDGVKKNCRHRLAEHNTRQRRMRMLRRTHRFTPSGSYGLPMHYDPMQQQQMMPQYHMPPPHAPVFGGSLPPTWGGAPPPMPPSMAPPAMSPEIAALQPLLDRLRGTDAAEYRVLEALHTILGSLFGKPPMNGPDPSLGAILNGAPPATYIPPGWGGYDAAPPQMALNPPPPPPASASHLHPSLVLAAAAAEASAAAAGPPLGHENGAAPPPGPPQANPAQLEEYMWLEQALASAAGSDTAKALESAASLLPLLNMHASQGR